MSTRRATVILAFSAALALAAQPALAQRAHAGGGGHPGGGGQPGAGHAVPRGGGYYGGGAQARHPQAGTGSYYHGYRGGYYGGHYSHYPYYGYGHYPYYGYYPYYGHSSFSFGLSFGWPYYYGGWYPYAYPAYGYYPGYYPPPSYGYGYDARQGPPPSEVEGGAPYGAGRTCSALRANGSDTGRVRLEARPDDASVYVDDEFCGNSREARFLTLAPGRHSIELVRPGFEVARRDADVVTGQMVDVLVELQRRTY